MEIDMNRDQVVGILRQFNGKIKEQWCKLHNDQIGQVAAKRHQIAGRTQALCATVQQDSAQQLRAFKHHYRTWRVTANMLPMQSQPAHPEQAGLSQHAMPLSLVSVKRHTELACA
jgi:uncharacterized protein YjbJ (UPF0337 family)